MDQENMNQMPAKKTGGSGAVIAIIVVILLIVGGAWLLRSNSDGTTNQAPAVNQQTEVNTMMDPYHADPTVKAFTVTGNNFKFDLPEIRVKKGDKVRITFNNQTGFHDFVLDEFNVKTRQYNGAATESISFLADKAGTFEYYCSVGQHRQMGMKGNLIIEE